MLATVSLRTRKGTYKRTKRSMLKVTTRLWSIIRAEVPHYFIPRAHTLGVDGQAFILRQIAIDLQEGKTVRYTHWDGTEGTVSPRFLEFFLRHHKDAETDLWFWLGEFLVEGK